MCHSGQELSHKEHFELIIPQFEQKWLLLRRKEEGKIAREKEIVRMREDAREEET